MIKQKSRQVLVDLEYLKIADGWFFQPAAKPELDISNIAEGGLGIRHKPYWLAYSRDGAAPQSVTSENMILLNSLNPGIKYPKTSLDSLYGEDRIQGLIDQKLLCEATDSLPDHHDWDPLARLYYNNARWNETNLDGTEFAQSATLNHYLSNGRNSAPPLTYLPNQAKSSIPLPSGTFNDFDSLLRKRRTCRQFDSNRFVSLQDFSSILDQVFRFTSTISTNSGLTLATRTSPAGGSIQATQCYILVQRVNGLAPGLYFYCSESHTLHLIGSNHIDSSEVQNLSLATRFLAGQEYFANAAAHFIMTTRFDRLFWKYRGHAKALKVSYLDAGHLGQTLHLAATNLNLGSYISAAVNDHLIEQALELNPAKEGVVALAGIGIRI